MKQELLFSFKLMEAKKSRTKITAFGGIPLLLATYHALGLHHVADRCLQFKKRGWGENSILEELIALQAAGGECMEDVEYLRRDDGKMLMGYDTFPSSVTVRRFLHSFDEGISEPRELGWAFIPEENSVLKSLNEVNRQLIRRMIQQENPSFLTVDADASVVQSYKQNALATYKGGTGYQPMLAVWAEKLLIIKDQFRDGNVNAAADGLEFLKQIESNLPRGKHNKKIKLRLRSDGAWYQHEIMEYCVEEGYEFSISADVSHGFKRWVLAIPEKEWKPLHQMSSEGKIKTEREYAVLKFTTASLSQANIKKRIEDYKYIVIRTRRTQYDLLEGAYHYDAIVTNMNWDIERQIHWHHERCGTIEKVIAILKNDLAGGRLPCGTFGANAAWFRINCLTHNLIQALKIIALPFEWFYARLKTLRFRLFCIAGRIINHARPRLSNCLRVRS